MKKLTCLALITYFLNAFSTEQLVIKCHPFYENGVLNRYAVILKEYPSVTKVVYYVAITDADFNVQKKTEVPINRDDDIEVFEVRDNLMGFVTDYLKTGIGGGHKKKIFTFDLKDMTLLGVMPLEKEGHMEVSTRIYVTFDGLFTYGHKEVDGIKLPWFTLYDKKLNMLWEKTLPLSKMALSDKGKIAILSFQPLKDNTFALCYRYMNKSTKVATDGFCVFNGLSTDVIYNHETVTTMNIYLKPANLMVLAKTQEGMLIGIKQAGEGEEDKLSLLIINPSTKKLVGEKKLSFLTPELSTTVPADLSKLLVSQKLTIDIKEIVITPSGTSIVGLISSNTINYFVGSKKSIAALSEYMFVAQLGEEDMKLKSFVCNKLNISPERLLPYYLAVYKDRHNEHAMYVHYQDYISEKKIVLNVLSFNKKLVKTEARPSDFGKFFTKIILYASSSAKNHIYYSQDNTTLGLQYH